MPRSTTGRRSVRAAFALSLLLACAALVFDSPAAGAGIAIGGALGWLSLWSLVSAAGRICQAPHTAGSYALATLLVLKLPIYLLLLLYAVARSHADPMAIFAGAAVAPFTLAYCAVDKAIFTVRPRSRGEAPPV